MKSPLASFFVALFLMSPGAVFAQDARCPSAWQGAFQLENDMVGGTDQHYTNGARFDAGGVGVKNDAALRHLWFLPKEPESCLIANFTLGLLMFTPRDIEVSEVQADDRPYAGWMYASYQMANFEILGEGEDYDVVGARILEVSLGVLGPLAQGEWFQDRVHDWRNIESRFPDREYKKPLGWHHQLRNEPALMAKYTQKWRVAGPPASASNRLYDVITHAAAAVGNIHTFAGGGATLRFIEVPGDFGPQARLDSMVTTKVAAEKLRQDVKRDPGYWYIFGTIDGRLVGRNAFLDGNVFVDNPSESGRVDKHPIVVDLVYGVVTKFNLMHWFSDTKTFPLTLSYQRVHRSPEFAARRGLPIAPTTSRWHDFGVISIVLGGTM